VLVFRAGPLLEEWQYITVGRYKLLYDAHKMPDCVNVSTEILSFSSKPWPIKVKAHWINKNALLMPYSNFHTGVYNVEPPVKLEGIGFDDHYYGQGPDVKGIDLLVFANSLAEGKAMTKALIRSTPELRGILIAAYRPQRFK